jgi:hypothetical protein
MTSPSTDGGEVGGLSEEELSTLDDGLPVDEGLAGDEPVGDELGVDPDAFEGGGYDASAYDEPDPEVVPDDDAPMGDLHP